MTWQSHRSVCITRLGERLYLRFIGRHGWRAGRALRLPLGCSPVHRTYCCAQPPSNPSRLTTRRTYLTYSKRSCTTPKSQATSDPTSPPDRLAAGAVAADAVGVALLGLAGCGPDVLRHLVEQGGSTLRDVTTIRIYSRRCSGRYRRRWRGCRSWWTGWPHRWSGS